MWRSSSQSPWQQTSVTCLPQPAAAPLAPRLVSRYVSGVTPPRLHAIPAFLPTQTVLTEFRAGRMNTEPIEGGPKLRIVADERKGKVLLVQVSC